METTRAGERRTRAWVLVKAEKGQAKKVAAKISALNDNTAITDQRNFVVRADLVTGTYDIVVPVDVESQKKLTTVVVEGIQAVDGVRETLTLVVGVHNPHPPHKAKGYVTDEEWKLHPHGVPPGPGLRGASPGENPWG